MKWIAVNNWPKYAEIGSFLNQADLLDDEVNQAADLIVTNKGTDFNPSNQAVAQALDAYERLQSKMDAMEGQLVTDQELARNNNILAATYRVSAQKLRDSLAPIIHSLETAKTPTDWSWIEAERKTRLARLQDLFTEMDKESKSKPRFMSFD